MATKRLRRGGGGTRKYGRNELNCKIYRAEHRREKSHIRRIEKHIKKNPRDRQAGKALIRYKKLLQS